ncbi:MAG TPA: Stk1 family PASTA domain-containing Ser/Thr kinase, partial [Candidatus Limnocylindrales bacterium]|nr:Stk1 family PASTA domain-containing Ser/Thr kinase [Candidatus Limnocylindrales bacterium]
MTEIGTILGGRYRLLELLGQGGMARIYRAHDSQLDRFVAVKLLRPEYGRDPDFGSRFRHEAQAAASLNHPNVVSVYDYGQAEAGPFIVMELVDGEDLAAIIKRSGALPPRQAARITAEAARAVHAAHGRGLIHRDIKPGNIMIDREGRVKVTDFGIARAIAEAQMTLPGTTLGSVHYFSPEQARGDQATAASDTYSLGIVLYELLTGRRPWEADSAAAVAMARLAGPPPDPSAVRAGIPSDLAAIDRKALATEPADRWSSASSLAAALEAFLAGTPLPGSGVAAGAAGTATIAGALGATSATARPNPQAIPYAPDAYASDRPARPVGASPVRDPRQARQIEDDRNEGGTSLAVWGAALIAVLILLAVGFLVFRLLSAPATPVSQVTVPNFVGKSLSDAQALATQSGIAVNTAAVASASGVSPNTVISQNPAAGTKIDKGGSVDLTLAAGAQTVAVPDLRGKTETDAINLLFSNGLKVGTKTEVFDPVVAAGLIVHQSPSAGVVVNQGTPVDYDISKGPEPSASPSPSPSPTPTPTPAPTPPPT